MSISQTILEIIDEDIIESFCCDCPAAEGEHCPAEWMPSEEFPSLIGRSRAS